MGDEFYNKITGDDVLYSEEIIEHITVQYVDDSNNVITSKNSGP